MATKQRQRRAPAKRRRSKKTSMWSRTATAVGRALDGHWTDVAGLTLVVAGLVAALGIYADLTGPAGRAVADVADAAVGVGRFLVPPALVWLGALLVFDRRAEEPGRVAVGLVLLLASSTALLHLGWEAGGGVGRLVASPLRSLLATWGASLVLMLVLGTALLVLTKTAVREAATRTAAGVRPVHRRASSWLRSLGELAGDRSDDDETPTVHVFDQDAADDDSSEATDPAPSKRAPKRSEVEVHVPQPDEAPTGEQLEIDLGPAGQKGQWKLPTLTMLERSGAHEVDRKMVEETGRTLENALAAHGVETRMVGATVGPTVTRYELELAPGVKVARVTSLHKDIAYAMASPDVRILAPIPGRSAIGVEVPNVRRQLVSLGDILVSEEAHKARHPLEVAIGRDISGRAVLANLAEMPHILIAGATGAGKSSCINSLITSLLMRSSPDQVRLILVDPKRVELGQYNRLPHLLTQVVVNPKKAANALAWAVREMERRYDLLAEVGVRDVTGYNGAFDRGELKAEPGVDKEYERLPFIVIVVDELNDLMMVAARDVEESICRIAQMARAVGIHLVIATQRPSVNVITGVIKANIPARLAFAVSSLADSRVILDQQGAERLVGRGDMLLLGPASSIPRRIQGCWVGEDEVRKVVAHWRRQSPDVTYVEGVEGDDAGAGIGALPGGSSGDADDDDLLRQAMELIVRSQLGSTSMLQRKLKVGFARAGRLMDLLEQRGVVGPSEGSKARAVLMTVEELEDLQAADA